VTNDDITPTRDSQVVMEADDAPGIRLGGSKGASSVKSSLAQALSPRNIGAVYVLIAIIIIFSIWEPSRFPTAQTFKNILNQYSITGLAAMSILLPLATGTFDLSIGSAIGLSGVLAGWLTTQTSLPWGLVILFSVALGAVIGAFNALIVVRFRIDSFIGTLATGSILAAVTIGLSGDQIITGRLAGGFAKLANSSLFGIQSPAIYLLVVMLVLGFVMEQTVMGRYLYSIGYNTEIARLVGVNVNRLRALSLLTSGTLAGFAGVVLAARVEAADPATGPEYLIPAFSAAFLGATQFRHGRFNPWGTAVAVLLIGVGSVGLLLTGAPSWAPNLFEGVVLIVAIGLTVREGKAAKEVH
jgi:ribose transport system permease protein